MSNKPYLQISADELFGQRQELTSYFTANDDRSYVGELAKAVSRQLSYIKNYGEKLWPASRIHYTLMALAANKIEDAREICSIESDIRSHRGFQSS